MTYKNYINDFIGRYNYIYKYLLIYKTYNDFIKIHLEKTKINKQLLNISDKYIRDKLYKTQMCCLHNKYMTDNWIYFKEDFRKFIDILIKAKLDDLTSSLNQEIISIFMNDYIHKITMLIKRLYHLFACLFDFYTIARVFRSYNKKKDEYYYDATNIIIYSGLYHYYVQKQFLSEFCDVIFETKNPDQCLNITDMKQPLFT